MTARKRPERLGRVAVGRNERTARRAVCLTLCVACCLLWGAGALAVGSDYSIQSPAAGAFSASQKSTLTAAIAKLEGILADRLLGPQLRVGERGWGSQEFAGFAAGSLGQLGYSAVVVLGTLDGREAAWVLVRVDLGQGEQTWIPVEVTPQGGAVQSTLGRIPWAGSGYYEDAYQSPQRLLDLGPNVAPTAVLRLPVAQVSVDEAATLLAFTSRDADGEIIVYLWSIDGSEPALTKTSSFEYTFQVGGVHTVTLTVVDNRGARATTTESVRLRSGDGEAVGTPPSSGGCGCGG